jgi:hypothetical protein
MGSDLLVKGPFRVRNADKMELGDSCILDSSKERSVCLDVGNKAMLKIGHGVYVNDTTIGLNPQRIGWVRLLLLKIMFGLGRALLS